MTDDAQRRTKIICNRSSEWLGWPKMYNLTRVFFYTLSAKKKEFKSMQPKHYGHISVLFRHYDLLHSLQIANHHENVLPKDCHFI